MTSATGLAAPVDVGEVRITVGRPIRLALLVGGDVANLAAARRVALASCADTVLAMRGADRTTLIERASALRDARADVVLLVAGVGADELAEAIRLAYGEAAHPVVLVSGPDRGRARLMGALAALSAEAAPPAASSYGRDALVARLRALRRPTGDAILRDESVEAAARALAVATSRAVVIVDTGSETTTLAFSVADGSSFAASAHVGVGANADRVVARAGIDRVRRWIPRAVDTPALLDRVFNRARRPETPPGSALTLALEMAIARESIAHVLAECERAGIDLAPVRLATTIVCCGVPAAWPRPQQCVLAVLDALAPETLLVIARDSDDALLRAVGQGQRTAGDVSALLRPVAIVATLSPRRPQKITVSDASGPVQAEVSRGALTLIPTTGAVELRAAGTTKATADTLELGVVLDARGRPLALPPRDAERIPALSRWTTALGVLPEAGAS